MQRVLTRWLRFRLNGPNGPILAHAEILDPRCHLTPAIQLNKAARGMQERCADEQEEKRDADNLDALKSVALDCNSQDVAAYLEWRTARKRGAKLSARAKVPPRGSLLWWCVGLQTAVLEHRPARQGLF